MLEWKAELIHTCETEARLASLRWQFGFMCSINDFSLIFWVLLPPYALLFSTVVTSDLPRTLASKIRFRAVELNCCQEKRIHSTCQCQPPLASHIESRNSTQACVHSPQRQILPSHSNWMLFWDLLGTNKSFDCMDAVLHTIILNLSECHSHLSDGHL